MFTSLAVCKRASPKVTPLPGNEKRHLIEFSKSDALSQFHILFFLLPFLLSSGVFLVGSGPGLCNRAVRPFLRILFRFFRFGKSVWQYLTHAPANGLQFIKFGLHCIDLGEKSVVRFLQCGLLGAEFLSFKRQLGCKFPKQSVRPSFRIVR